MRTAFVLALSLLLPSQTPPDTEVFLAPLTREGGQLVVGRAENISNSPGYDNQPSFSPDGRFVYFTSGRSSGQMDIYRHDTSAKQITQVTTTPESEYSATVMPDGAHISVVRVEADKIQRLWKFTTAGRDPSVLLPDIKPVGYHAWLDQYTLALFVLGQPPTLQVADIRTGKAVIAATDIGRSLQRIPGGGVSFVQRSGEGPNRTSTIVELTLRLGKPVTTTLTPLARGATEEFVAWTPDGTLLMAAGTSLHGWRRGDKEWRVIADLGAIGVGSVSRIAVNPRGDWLALVGTVGG
jgi:hypothetical protein